MLNTKKISAQLCVVGGGLAGIATAISAARNGVKVVLIQERPVLGGNASSEVRMWVCGAFGENNRETGIIEEIMLENLYRNPTKNFYIWDSILLDFVKREENICLLLNTTCLDIKTVKGNFKHGRDIRIESVKAYQMTTQTFYEIDSKFFADCSGDSILAPLSGALFRYGREAADEFNEETRVKEKDNLVMGMSCLIQGRETNQEIKYIASEFATKLSEQNVSNRPMDLYNPTENFWYLELGGLKDTISDAEKTKEELINLALGTWDYIKNHDEYNAKNFDLEFLGFIPAKRESRRMVGEYIINQQDISSGKIFEDTIAYGGWPMDDHFPAGYFHKGEPNTIVYTPSPYSLPYRALYSKNVENLFFAGRNISMTHMAMSSIRVMATTMLLGQAVGTAVSIAVREDCSPHDVYLNNIKELQQKLMKDDCFLPHFRREISSLCKKTAILNADDSLKTGSDRNNNVYAEGKGIQIKNNVGISYNFDDYHMISDVHIVFDSDLNRETLPGVWSERVHSMRSNVLLNSPQMHMPLTLCKAFKLIVSTADGEKIVFEQNNNIKRAYNISINEKVNKIELVLLENWGKTEKTNLISFDF